MGKRIGTLSKVLAGACALVLVGIVCFAISMGNPFGSSLEPSAEQSSSTAQSPSAVSDSRQATYEANEVLISANADCTDADLAAALKSVGAENVETAIVSDYGANDTVIKVRYSGDVDAHDAATALASSRGVTAAEPNYTLTFSGDVDSDSSSDFSAGSAITTSSATLASSPSADVASANQWHLDAIKAQGAWNIQKSNGAVTVAVIDSGVDTDNPDLDDNLLLDYAYCPVPS